mgnify:FL=1
MGSGISPMSLVVHYNQNAPVYGYLDFDRQVNEAVKKAVQLGGYHGILKRA